MNRARETKPESMRNANLKSAEQAASIPAIVSFPMATCLRPTRSKRNRSEMEDARFSDKVQDSDNSNRDINSHLQSLKILFDSYLAKILAVQLKQVLPANPKPRRQSSP